VVRLQTHLASSALPLSPTNSASAAEWDRRYRATETVWSLIPNQTLVDELSDSRPERVVDLAGGEGRNALFFAGRGSAVENVEFSQVALEKFQARAAQAGLSHLTHSTLSDAQTANFSLDPDLVITCYLQLPWEQLRQSLDNALSQLSQGELFGIWHARRNLTDGYGGPQNAEVLPTPEQLKQWLASHKLAGRVWEVERTVTNDEGAFVAIDVVMRAQVGH